MKPIERELNELAALIGRFQRGEFNRAEFRGHSVHYGVYTQRQPDRYFVRIRAPLGILTVAQLNALADATDRWANGKCHLTTRQGVEVHDLLLDQIMPLLRTLAEADLLSHETGGNSIRGIMVCPHAGVGADEPFDVTPYAGLLTRYFVRHPDFQSLPRKMKLAFSCCAADCAQTALCDLGFQARLHPSGQFGFRVMVGGGAGALPRLAKELIEFLPAMDSVIFTEAFLRVFNRLGERKNRRRARVKFLVESLGLERLREEVTAEWNSLKAARKDWPSVEQPFKRPTQDDPQHSLRAALHGGNITSGQLRRLALLVGQHALTLRITPEQDFLLRGIWPEQLGSIQTALLESEFVPEDFKIHLTACPGSTACSNAFTNSPALGQAISRELAKAGNTGADEPLRIRVSGCTNGCALHVIADIGLEGLAQRREGFLIPAYRVWLGGRAHQQQPRLATDLGIVPARRAADCVTDLAFLYRCERRPGESLPEVLNRIGVEPFVMVTQRYQQFRDFHELATDVGEQTPYRAPGDAAATC